VINIKNRFNELIKKWKEKQREKRIIDFCGCITYCPGCKDMLNDQASCREDEDGFIFYECNTCGRESKWHFDIAPCPILLKSNINYSE